MKKMLLALTLVGLAADTMLDARGGGHGGGGFHGGGFHGGGFHGGGRGWGGRGWGGRGWGGGWGYGGWGWGPAFGIGLDIPVGGPNYEAPQPVPSAGDPYYRYMSLFNSDPVKNRKAYRRWLFDNYPADQAQSWYNSFLVNFYNPYQASKPTASLSIGTGVGFGGYYGRGWRR